MQPADGYARELAEIFRDELAIDVPSPETDLVNTGLLDSLALVDLLLQIEQRFGLVVAMDQLKLEDFRSVNSISGFLERQQSA